MNRQEMNLSMLSGLIANNPVDELAAGRLKTPSIKTSSLVNDPFAFFLKDEK